MFETKTKLEFDKIKVSIIIPCRNEEKHIKRCLDSIIANDFPRERLEVLVADGISSDTTRDIVNDYAQKNQFLKLLKNPKKTTSCALNIGIEHSMGDVIMKIDAHSIYKKDYISNCLKYLIEFDADNVGGILIPISDDKSLISEAIGLVISSPFGVGGSYFRIGSTKPRWVDTVAFGCYRKQVFEKIGLYNEDLVRGQDMEFNSRLRKSGGKILLHPKIIGYYYYPNTFFEFLRHNFTNGLWAILPFKHSDVLPVTLRHLVPLAFISITTFFGFAALFNAGYFLMFISIAALYVLANLYFSVTTALRERNWRMIFLMPPVYAILHVSYGLGSLCGFAAIAASNKFWRNLKHILWK